MTACLNITVIPALGLPKLGLPVLSFAVLRLRGRVGVTMPKSFFLDS